MPGKRRNISVTDDVWERWEGAAAGAGAKRGMAMPVSEWLRVAAREKIERDHVLPPIEPGDKPTMGEVLKRTMEAGE